VSGGEAVYPVFLKLRGRRVLLVGGGTVAAAKLPGLLTAGAQVVVVAPEVRAEIAAAAFAVRRRGFRPGDLAGAWLVVAAAPPEVNREVARAASGRRLFVNAVDDPGNASAYLGGVVRRGGVTIAVSTDGEAPALAGLLREGLAALLPTDIARWVCEAAALKRRQRAAGVPIEKRRPQLLVALERLYAPAQEGAER
jgi:uroporphyrin-III C-methyltransferase/precorrin-2 dehydrogenase/sirohydrochlorin ferrochelatase